MKTGTPAERRLAKYYMEHPGDISYETAASVADRLDLSPMTVGRFLRAMDIDSYGTSPSVRGITPFLADRDHGNPGMGEPAMGYDHIRDQVEALQLVQTMIRQSAWKQVVELLARPAEVFLTSVGHMLPMSAYFASRLAEIRDGVRHLSGGDGTYLELLGSRKSDCVLVILDDRNTSSRLHRLCKAARETGHRVLMITHSSEAWLESTCDLLVRAPALSARGGLDPVALAAIIEIAVTDVGISNGPFAVERAGKVAELQRLFGEAV